MEHSLICKWCGEPFLSKRSDKLFCVVGHKTQYNRSKQLTIKIKKILLKYDNNVEVALQESAEIHLLIAKNIRLHKATGTLKKWYEQTKKMQP